MLLTHFSIGDMVLFRAMPGVTNKPFMYGVQMRERGGKDNGPINGVNCLAVASGVHWRELKGQRPSFKG